MQSKPDIKALPPGRVCQPPFADLKAEAEDRFGYAGAERIETRWRAERIETRWRAERIETRWRAERIETRWRAERIETRWRVQV